MSRVFTGVVAVALLLGAPGRADVIDDALAFLTSVCIEETETGDLRLPKGTVAGTEEQNRAFHRSLGGRGEVLPVYALAGQPVFLMDDGESRLCQLVAFNGSFSVLEQAWLPWAAGFDPEFRTTGTPSLKASGRDRDVFRGGAWAARPVGETEFVQVSVNHMENTKGSMTVFLVVRPEGQSPASCDLWRELC